MSRGKVLVIYFQDVRAAEKKLADIRRAELSGPVSTENILYGDEIAGASEILSLCRTPPFFGDYRLVILRRAEKMPAALARQVHEGLARPPACAFLVILRQEKKRGNLPFAHAWCDYPLKGEEREMEDGFGLAAALERGDRRAAFRVLEHQFRSEHRDFPRFFGLLGWYLRSRLERGAWPLTAETAALFERFYELEHRVRTGLVPGRAAIELALLALLEQGGGRGPGRRR